MSVVLLAAFAGRAETVFENGPARAALLELYTSQGCSSCPPADRWFSGLTDRAALWRDFVPVAFHVDYWDYIGWKDPFADPAYGQRQRRYAAEGGVETVYTPGMFANGREWRGWSRKRLPDPDGGMAGILTVRVGADAVRLDYRPAADGGKSSRAYLAWLGFGLRSDVRAGENRGRVLNNDFVVLAFENEPLRSSGELRSARFGHFSGDGAARPRAFAAWVVSDRQQAPLQAVGGWLESSGMR